VQHERDAECVDGAHGVQRFVLLDEPNAMWRRDTGERIRAAHVTRDRVTHHEVRLLEPIRGLLWAEPEPLRRRNVVGARHALARRETKQHPAVQLALRFVQ
jgi:hypothetical protein